MKYLLVSTLLAIGFTIAGCSQDKTERPHSDSAISIQAVFDVPKLLTMDISQVKKVLGEPISEFVSTEIQISMVPSMLATVEYMRGTTSIQIDYSRSGQIKAIFIADVAEGRKVDEILLLGNLDPNSTEYSLRIQDWLNPTLAKQQNAAEIAGIEVTLK